MDIILPASLILLVIVVVIVGVLLFAPTRESECEDCDGPPLEF